MRCLEVECVSCVWCMVYGFGLMRQGRQKRSTYHTLYNVHYIRPSFTVSTSSLRCAMPPLLFYGSALLILRDGCLRPTEGPNAAAKDLVSYLHEHTNLLHHRHDLRLVRAACRESPGLGAGRRPSLCEPRYGSGPSAGRESESRGADPCRGRGWVRRVGQDRRRTRGGPRPGRALRPGSSTG